jgi:hypothetical protein
MVPTVSSVFNINGIFVPRASSVRKRYLTGVSPFLIILVFKIILKTLFPTGGIRTTVQIQAFWGCGTI